MASDAQVATVVLLSVAASFPCFLYGAWIMIDNERITWGVLTYHLKFILTGLMLTTVPLVGWMVPRLFDQLGGFAAVHAFFGLQAYAFLLFGFTGIVRIFRAKYEHDLYSEYDEDVFVLGPEDADNASEAEKQEGVGLQAEEGVDGGESAELVE